MCMSYGLPLINVGVTIYLYPEDYGKDPRYTTNPFNSRNVLHIYKTFLFKSIRAFIGWENDTKMVFFYGTFILNGLATLLALIILFNVSTPQTRKDGIITQLSDQVKIIKA